MSPEILPRTELPTLLGDPIPCSIGIRSLVEVHKPHVIPKHRDCVDGGELLQCASIPVQLQKG